MFFEYFFGEVDEETNAGLLLSLWRCKIDDCEDICEIYASFPQET